MQFGATELVILVTLKHSQNQNTPFRLDRNLVWWLRVARVSLKLYFRSHRLVRVGGTELYLCNGQGQIELQEKLEAREPLEIDSFFDSTRDRLEKKQAEFEHFM